MSDMSPEEYRRFAHQVSDWIADYLRDIREYPVLPAIQPGQLSASLPESAPDQGESMDAILRDFRDLIVPANTHWNHPRFHGYFSVSASCPGILAETLVAALNTNGMVWKSNPASTELEQRVLAWLRDWLGLPQDNFGLIHDTASISTMHALGAAREYKDPDTRENGAKPGLVIYTSAHAHSSVEKSAMALGFGRKYIRAIDVDEQFRMSPQSLREAIEQDIAAGLTPCCIVPTVGTTGVTAIDPVREIARIAAEHDCWLHVDAAYGGIAAILPEYRHLLDGAELAHSLVVNPHKWLFTPIDCSVLYTRRPDIMRRAYSLVPEFLRTQQDEIAANHMDYAVALGRRFRSLKLWFVMRYFGKERAAAIIRSHIEYAKKLAKWIEEDDRFELSAPVTLALVCFRFKEGDEATKALMDQVNASGKAFLSHTTLNGRFVIRCSIGHVRATEADVEATWSAILQAVPAMAQLGLRTEAPQ